MNKLWGLLLVVSFLTLSKKGEKEEENLEVKEKQFYFIKDEFFKELQDTKLLQNKENGNKRPCYYCFKQKQEDKMIWLIPISSKIEKYKKIYIAKLKRYKEVDTIVFGKVKGKENAFLIQNMFPVLEEYIESRYTYHNNPIEITFALQQEIDAKANKILSLVRQGYKNLVFPDILEIEKSLQRKLRT